MQPLSREKIAILEANPANTLNQRTELVSKCRHKAKYKLRNHQPNSITFDANCLITVTLYATLYLLQCLEFLTVFLLHLTDVQESTCSV